jgi:hypothetical protein
VNAQLKKEVIFTGDGASAFLPGTRAIVYEAKNSKNFLRDPDRTPQSFTLKNKQYRGEVYWGESNDLPLTTIDKIYKNPVVASGTFFNVLVLYGQGVVYGRMLDVNGKRQFVQADDVEEINTFFEENDINGYLLEQATDMVTLFNCFPEIIFNRENKRKVVNLLSKEAAFSRWEEMDSETAVIRHHFYSAKWGKSMEREKDLVVTPVLDSRWPLRDLKMRMGLLTNDKGTKTDLKEYRYIIPLNFPTPGRSYYQKPYYFSIFESGWYDYACKIPEFKNALLDNQMVIKYHVELSEDYFSKIFSEEGITEDEKKKARVKAEYAALNKFLSSQKNSGKSVISFVSYTPDGKEKRRMKITVLENLFKGGEYIDDSEEASNIMSYGMGVHPSLIGSAPGKSKTINGTEARELWIIKQALMKPMRDRLLMPLNLIKAINEWPKEIVFAIPNIELTTLDKGTGSEKVIS